jgi:transmembrane sensor
MDKDERMNMDDLLIKYVLGEATPDEIARVGQWLAAGAGNRARYEQFKTIWSISRQTAAPAPQDTGAALQRFRQRNAAVNSPKLNGHPVNNYPSRAIRSLRFWRMAAVFAGTLFIGGGTWYVLSRSGAAPGHSSPAAAYTIRARNPAALTPATSPADTEAGVIVNSIPPPDDAVSPTSWQQVATGNTTELVSLPDNSIVTLNRYSSISYPSGNNKRGLTLHLKGEAFFSVTHDPSRPFVVQVNDVTVKVLGTSFEIRSGRTGTGSSAGTGSVAGTGGMTTELIVETGAVRISRGTDSLLLHAGEKAVVLPKEKLKMQPNKDRLYGYYLDRPLVCDSVSLQRLVEVLNESYGAHVVIGRQELDSLPLTTVFHHEPLDKILTIIAATFDLSIVYEGQSIILK